MTTHSLTEKEWRRPAARRGTGNGVLQLCSVHFWLLIGLLGGVLGPVVLVLFAHLSAL